MLIPNHPDEGRLSALAARDDDAVADAALTSHVSTCSSCAEVVTELGALRASLAELPDLVPHRPLQLLPPVADAPAAAGAAGWVRRLFAPVLTVGAAIAMVGLVGTAGPLLGGMASSAGVFQDAGGDAQEAAEEPAGAETDYFGRSNEEPSASEAARRELAGEEPGDGLTTLPAERSIWPMVLFTGIALMVAAALLRWILVPRAG